MDRRKLEELFIDVAKSHEDYYDIKSQIRSLHSCDMITDEDYNYILAEWDNLLIKHGLMKPIDIK